MICVKEETEIVSKNQGVDGSDGLREGGNDDLRMYIVNFVNEEQVRDMCRGFLALIINAGGYNGNRL